MDYLMFCHLYTYLHVYHYLWDYFTLKIDLLFSVVADKDGFRFDS